MATGRQEHVDTPRRHETPACGDAACDRDHVLVIPPDERAQSLGTPEGQGVGGEDQRARRIGWDADAYNGNACSITPYPLPHHGYFNHDQSLLNCTAHTCCIPAAIRLIYIFTPYAPLSLLSALPHCRISTPTRLVAPSPAAPRLSRPRMAKMKLYSPPVPHLQAPRHRFLRAQSTLTRIGIVYVPPRIPIMIAYSKESAYISSSLHPTGMTSSAA